MRVTFSNNPRRALITLGKAEKPLWQSTTADGRDVDAARRRVIAKARLLLADGRPVTVVAPARAGGWVAEDWVPGDLGIHV